MRSVGINEGVTNRTAEAHETRKKAKEIFAKLEHGLTRDNHVKCLNVADMKTIRIRSPNDVVLTSSKTGKRALLQQCLAMRKPDQKKVRDLRNLKGASVNRAGEKVAHSSSFGIWNLQYV